MLSFSLFFFGSVALDFVSVLGEVCFRSGVTTSPHLLLIILLLLLLL